MFVLDTFDIPVLLLVGAALALSLVVSFVAKLRTVGPVKIKFTLFDPYNIPGFAFPTTWWNAGLMYTWTNRLKLYNDADTFALVPLLYGGPYIFTRSIPIARQATAHNGPFDKAFWGTRGLRIFGENVVTTMSHGQWNRHRKVVNPAFNQRLYQQVWNSSVQTFKDMSTGEGWDMKDSVDLPDIRPFVGKFALLIITAVGFGMPLPWNDPPGSEGGDMTLLEAFKTLTDTLLLAITVPKWTFSLPFDSLRRTKRSHEKVFSVMEEFVAERRAVLSNKTDKEKLKESRTIFGLLLDANDSESGKTVLNDQELFSNVFVMLFAGHETSAQTMGATLGLLSIHPEEQDKAYAHIKSVLGDRDPTIDDFEALRPIQGCLLEGLRLFPTAALLIRQPLEDVMLQPDGEEQPIPMSKNAIFIGDMTGISYNPRYYANPTAYIPSRWSGHDEPVFMSFGSGPRACIGRKFAMYEMTCFLTLLLRDWKVEPVLRYREDMETWRKRVLEDTVTLTATMGPGKVPLKITRRV